MATAQTVASETSTAADTTQETPRVSPMFKISDIKPKAPPPVPHQLLDRVAEANGFTSREVETVADDEVVVRKKKKKKKSEMDSEQTEQLGLRCYIDDYNKFVDYAASRRVSYKVAFAEIMAMVPDSPRS